MTPEAGPSSIRPAPRAAGWCAVLVCLAGLSTSTFLMAQAPAAKPAARAAVEQGVRWRELKPAQQAALKPLEQEWPTIDGRSKDKWLELATRFPKLTADQQARVQERMGAWAHLTPRERGEARLHFQEAKQLPPQDRQARWNAYQALTPEQRQRLAARASPAELNAAAEAARRASNGANGSRERAPREGASLKSPAAPRAITPSVVQARPGATTTLITRSPAPPNHPQAGVPRIAATPEYIDKATLLPQRDPHAMPAHAAPTPASQPALARP